MTQTLLDFDHVAAPILARVEAAAERALPGFSESARDFVLQYLRQHGPSTGEDIVDAAKQAGIVPTDDRHFGPVFCSLSRSGQIVTVGFGNRAKGHGVPGARMWRATA